jgi:hypothetical protein
VFLCVLALRKKASAGLSAVYLAMCGLCAAIYNFGYAMEINATSQAGLFYWVRFQHIGIQFIVPFTSTPLKDKSGKVIGKLVNFNDVSDLKELSHFQKSVNF